MVKLTLITSLKIPTQQTIPRWTTDVEIQNTLVIVPIWTVQKIVRSNAMPCIIKHSKKNCDGWNPKHRPCLAFLITVKKVVKVKISDPKLVKKKLNYCTRDGSLSPTLHLSLHISLQRLDCLIFNSILKRIQKRIFFFK